MELALIISISGVCVLAIITVKDTRRFLNETKHKIQSYQFYALRDQLYWLVLDSKISTKNLVFTAAEKDLNHSVHLTRYYNMGTFVKFVVEYDGPDRETQLLLDQNNKFSEEAKKFYENYFRTLMLIILDNSPITSTLYRVRRLRSIGRFLIRLRIAKYMGLKALQRKGEAIEKLTELLNQLTSGSPKSDYTQSPAPV